MSDEEITYTTVRFGKSSESQTRGRPDETQGPRGTAHRECLAPWYLVAISLGILCSLLVAVAVLVAYVSQYSGNNHELQKTLNNLTQQYQTLQSNNALMKKVLRNKSRELDDFKRQKELDSCNRCCGETKVLDCIQLTGKYIEAHLFCCGIKCYYFIMGNKHWNDCKLTCQDCRLSLLKIDDEDELKFLQKKVNPNSYWIGLSYNAKKSEWQWIDNGPSNLDLMTVKSLQRSRGCATLGLKGINPFDCGRIYPCICEKRKDKFPHSVCTMEEK